MNNYGPSPFGMNPLAMSGIGMYPQSFMGMSNTGMNPLTPIGMCPMMPSFIKETFYESKIKDLEEQLRQKNDENRNLKQRLINNGTININQNYNSMYPTITNRNITPNIDSKPYGEPKFTYNDNLEI